jgi:uncharacterized tellurite resistance protein B-like protein
MIPGSMVIHKNFADFVLFLYVHMAYADGGLHHSEKDVIVDKMHKLFPKENNPLKKLEAAEKEYMGLDSKKVPGLILDTFRQFREVKFVQKYKIYTDMYDIINADGEVHSSEKAALEELKKIINLGAAAKG